MTSVGGRAVIRNRNRSRSGYQCDFLGFITTFLKKEFKDLILVYDHGSQFFLKIQTIGREIISSLPILS
jgi:hypothetical protein